ASSPSPSARGSGGPMTASRAFADGDVLIGEEIVVDAHGEPARLEIGGGLFGSDLVGFGGAAFGVELEVDDPHLPAGHERVEELLGVGRALGDVVPGVDDEDTIEGFWREKRIVDRAETGPDVS